MAANDRIGAQIYLSRAELEALDEACQQAGLSRSAVGRMLLLRWVREQGIETGQEPEPAASRAGRAA